MRDDFRHATHVQVRLGDLDPFGHVNNAVVATYVEQGRVLYLRDGRLDNDVTRRD